MPKTRGSFKSRQLIDPFEVMFLCDTVGQYIALQAIPIPSSLFRASLLPLSMPFSQFHFLPSPAKERLSCLCLCPRPALLPGCPAWGQPGVINVIFDFITQKHFVIPKWSDDDDELNYMRIEKNGIRKKIEKKMKNLAKYREKNNCKIQI